MINGFYYCDDERIAGEPQFVLKEDYDSQYTQHVKGTYGDPMGREEFYENWEWVTADDFEDERFRQNMAAEIRFSYFPEITEFIKDQLEKWEDSSE